MASCIDAPAATAAIGVGLWRGMRGPQASIDWRDVTFCDPAKGVPLGERP